MNPTDARRALTPSRIRDTVIVLEALDCLQARAWEEKFESRVREITPHSESVLVTMANEAIRDFVHNATPGNAQGVPMNISVFVNGLVVAGLEPEASIAMDACSYQDLSL